MSLASHVVAFVGILFHWLWPAVVSFPTLLLQNNITGFFSLSLGMETVGHYWILYNSVFSAWITVACFGCLPRTAETWSLAWVPGRMVPQSGLTLITVPQGLTPDPCGLASRTRCRSAANVLLCCHIPLPAPPVRPSVLLSVFGLRLRRTDVAPVPFICAAIRWRGHPMVPSFHTAG